MFQVLRGFAYQGDYKDPMEHAESPKKAWIFRVLLAALAVGIVCEYFFFSSALGINYFLFIGLLIASLFILFPERLRSGGWRVIFLIAGSLYFSGMVFFRASELLTALNVLASLGLLALIVESAAGNDIRQFGIVRYVSAALLPVKCFPYFFVGMGELSDAVTRSERHPTSARILKGVAVALPIVGMLVVLLSSADLVFRKYVTELFTFDYPMDFLAYCVRTAVATGVAFSAYLYIAKERSKPRPEAAIAGTAGRHFGSIETGVVLGSVSLVFLAFLVIQFTYLFGGEGAVAAQGFAYSEYARRGFFELIAVSLIAFFLLFVSERSVQRDGERHSQSFKWLAGILILETLLVMLSAFQRLSLYELAYGFTTLRLYSHIFILWIGTVFLLLGYEIFIREDRAAFAFRGLVSMVLFLAAVNILNPDQFIARENIERYRTTGEIDLSYLGSLSEDALPLVMPLVSDQSVSDRTLTDEAVAEDYALFLNHLVWKQDYKSHAYYAGWQATQYSRGAAREIFKAHPIDIQNP